MTTEKVPQIQDVIAASDMLAAELELRARINDAAFPSISLNPNMIFCSKTGQPIGSRDANSTFAAIKICGKTEFVENAFLAHGLHVAPAWIKTDGDSLDVLMENDAIAYASYMLGIITAKFTAKPARPTPEHIARHHYALARAYAILNASASIQAYDPIKKTTGLTELNFALCEFLSFAPETTNYITRKLGEHAKTPDHLARMAVDGSLLPILETINKASFQANHFSAMLVRNHLGNLPFSQDEGGKGPSAVRSQSRSKSRAKALRLAAQFQEFGFGRIETAEEAEQLATWAENHKPKWTKFIVREEAQDKPLPKGFEQLANLNLEDWVMPNEEPDNEVTVRTMTADEYAAHEREKFPVPLPEIIKPVIETPTVSGANAAIFATIKAQAPAAQEQAKPVNRQVSLLAALAQKAKK